MRYGNLIVNDKAKSKRGSVLLVIMAIIAAGFSVYFIHGYATYVPTQREVAIKRVKQAYNLYNVRDEVFDPLGVEEMENLTIAYEPSQFGNIVWQNFMRDVDDEHIDNDTVLMNMEEYMTVFHDGVALMVAPAPAEQGCKKDVRAYTFTRNWKTIPGTSITMFNYLSNNGIHVALSPAELSEETGVPLEKVNMAWNNCASPKPSPSPTNN